MFDAFMQMSGPAAFAIVGTLAVLAGAYVFQSTTRKAHDEKMAEIEVKALQARTVPGKQVTVIGDGYEG